MDKNPIKILVIEDNIGDLILLTESLEEEFVNLDLLHASTARDAKEKLQIEQGIDIILLDLSLPDESGELLAQNILDQAQKIPVIVLTGYTDKNFAIKSIGLGTSDYLVKDELNSATLYKSIIYSRERKRATNQLRESEKRYKELFHLSPQPMWVYNVETLEFLDVNDAAILHYGYSMEEFMSMTILDIRPSEDQENFQESLKDTVKNNGALGSKTFRHKKKNGDLIQVEITSNKILFQDREARIVLASDITERVAYISAIQTQNEKLKDIAWIQSHVVRAPLSRLMGLVNAIQMDDSINEDTSALLDYIKNSAEELDEIVRKINKKTELIEPEDFNEDKK